MDKSYASAITANTGRHSVDHQHTAIREEDQFHHGTVLGHVLNLPASGNTLTRQNQASTLVGSRGLGRIGTRSQGIVESSSTTGQDFRSEVILWRQGEHGKPRREWVTDPYAVGYIRKARLCVRLPVEKHRLLVGCDEEVAIRESEDIGELIGNKRVQQELAGNLDTVEAC